MTIDNYLKLTSVLVHNFLGSLYPSKSKYDQKQITSTDKLVQYNLVDKDNNDNIVLVTSISELSETSVLVNFIFEGESTKTIDNLLVDWTDSDLAALEIRFPLSELNLPQSIINGFNKKVKSLAICANLDELFAADQSRLRRLSAISPPPHSSPNPLENEADLLDSKLPKSSLISDPPVHRRPNDMPDFEDELEIRGSASGFGPSSSVLPAIGDRDLNPPGLPRHPEMKPFVDPLAQGGNDGGMYPSLDHPVFGGRHEGGNTSRLGVPPGARFDDPYGEDNLDSLGSGLPGNLRGGSFGSGGSGNTGFPGFGGSGGGGFSF
ncbi:predicted protein [Scheffersomyces stipitis CBS 6054]|uniref:PI31 proteasome regulator C-terminal domain-containing protein n=1 Tax=Scheffersomyces stipitis (strain ATCC 58785 / CBS 6054 / NBRC 10063 / NRRL Y-11545) TaxID=322104 RepID=A3LW66_PICST|nr:predicted protein [Scheffersomyces stipitis CBS 6054]ABN67228.2 predicted protein [Scheffersomyces stipitis CBS 6054]KAG2734347.1 hypothetical protein G9P44_002353 [Scheffersomyces stipitis]